MTTKEIAKAILDFYDEYDPYGYMDEVADYESAFAETEADLHGAVEWLQGFADDGNDEAQEIIDMIMTA